jgi:hypothetical protein
LAIVLAVLGLVGLAIAIRGSGVVESEPPAGVVATTAPRADDNNRASLPETTEANTSPQPNTTPSTAAPTSIAAIFAAPQQTQEKKAPARANSPSQRNALAPEIDRAAGGWTMTIRSAPQRLKYFVLSSPPRFVVDLFDTRRGGDPLAIDPAVRGVRKIRVRPRSGFTRYVVDFSGSTVPPWAMARSDASVAFRFSAPSVAGRR